MIARGQACAVPGRPSHEGAAGSPSQNDKLDDPPFLDTLPRWCPRLPHAPHRVGSSGREGLPCVWRPPAALEGTARHLLG
jgi:hypothetical protein